MVSGTQQQGDPRCGVVLRSSNGSLCRSEPKGKIMVASGYAAAKLPSSRRSEVSHSKTGAQKVMIFWAIDGPNFRDIKRERFRGKNGVLETN